MKKSICYLLVISALVACGKSKKQRLENVTDDPLHASITTNGFGGIKDTTSQEQKEDTTIYKEQYSTAEIKDASEYFRTNNRFKDWDKSKKTFVFLAGTIEKDGSISKLRIGKSSGKDELDKEAIRLIRNATMIPAKNEFKQPVRFNYCILVHFPPQ